MLQALWSLRKNFWSFSASTQLTVTTFTALASGWPSGPITVVVLCHNPGSRAGSPSAKAGPAAPSRIRPDIRIRIMPGKLANQPRRGNAAVYDKSPSALAPPFPRHNPRLKFAPEINASQ